MKTYDMDRGLGFPPCECLKGPSHYDGNCAQCQLWPAACRDLVELPSIKTYPAERRELLKNFPRFPKEG